MAKTASLAAVLPLLFAAAAAQQIGAAVPEVHPKLPTLFCTTAGGCVQRQTSLVTDALSRSLHVVGNPAVPCSVGNKTQCPDATTCSKNCALEGVDYGQMGVSTNGNAVTLSLFSRNANGTGLKTLSPRLYLVAEDDKNYELFQLVNKELTYDVDVSKVGCGVNGALYLSEMDVSGSRNAANPAGAQYGTGYCDAQCPRSTFINGIANLNNSGACCNEMDIWEANNAATQMTPHTCSGTGSFLCSSSACAKGGVCDQNGCGINPFASGSKSFYGPGKTVDTRRPFTVVTQFISANNSTTGALSTIRRMYVQDGQMIESAPTQNGTVSSLAAGVGTITQDFCADRGNSTSDFIRLGGIRGMGESLNRGMVLIFSIWDAPGDFMTWLDSGSAGPCSATQGDPRIIMMNNSDAAVTFSNIRWGDIGSTVKMAANGSELVSAVAVNDAVGLRAGPASLLAAGALLFGYLLL